MGVNVFLAFESTENYSLSSSLMLEQAELSLLLVDRWLGLSISSLRFACKTNPAPMSSSISNFTLHY